MKRPALWFLGLLPSERLKRGALFSRPKGNSLFHLPSLADEIDTMNTTTESEFLEIGAKLQFFYQASREISQISSSIMTLLAGEEITGAIEGLRRIFSNMERAAQRSKQHSGELQNLARMVEHANRALGGFQRYVQELNILCISIRIESARLGDSQAGFDTLADDIKRLTGEIEEKSDAILEKLDFLDKLVHQKLARIMKIEESQQGQTRTILAHTSSSLADLVEHYEKSLGAARKTAASYEELTGITGEIVCSVQFHDITRQQMEHVCESLRRLGEQRQGEEGLAEVCELQAAQIRFAGEKLWEAVEGIVGNLRSTGQKIVDITGQLHEIAGDAAQEGSGFFFKTEEHLNNAYTVLLEFEEKNRDLMSAMDSIGGALNEMSSFVGDIRQLGQAIRLIALNSIVKSAHVGDRGAALGVLAIQIHGLSLHTGRQTEEISEAFESITSSAGQLRSGGDSKDGASAQSSTAAMIKTIERLKESLRETNRLVTSRMAEIENAAATLTGEIDRTSSAIDIHERALATIKKIASELDEVALSLRADGTSGGEPEGGARGAELLKQIEQSYTMNSERELHQQVSASAATMQEPEKAQAAQGAENTESSQNEEEDLGDNVELF